MSRLIDDAAPDEKLDRNLLAAIVIVCAKGMGDIYVERLQGILEGIIKPSNEEIDKWPALIDEWFAPVIQWIHQTIKREEEDEAKNRITIIHEAEPIRSPWTPWVNPDPKKAKPPEPKKKTLRTPVPQIFDFEMNLAEAIYKKPKMKPQKNF